MTYIYFSKVFSVYDEDEGVPVPSFLLIDDKSVCREVTISTLELGDLLDNLLDTIKIFKTLKLEDSGLESESGGNIRTSLSHKFY